MKLLGSVRTDTCRGCIAGRDKTGPGSGQPHSRRQVVIAVRSGTYTLQCSKCGTRNVRKLSKINVIPKAAQTFASLKK